MKRYTISPGAGVDGLLIEEVDALTPGPREVVVAMKAASLNFRDLMILDGHYPGMDTKRIVPLSDGAGEVIAIGERVSRFAVGDRVAGIFLQSWQGGEMTDADGATALGGAVDGVLAEQQVFSEDGLVSIPDHLSFEQAATLPCAAVTAWNALFCHRPLRPGQTVLTMGTGGVSIFAVQFALAAGAKIIGTSSSDEKLQRLRNMGVAELINYANTPEWGAQAKAMTGGRGVDCVVEVGGAGTLPQSLAATARGGSVEMIGVLTSAQIDPFPILIGGLTVRGFMVGSREMFEAMNRAISAHKIVPVVDRTFAFAEVADAYRYLRSGRHFGKVVIQIAG